MIKAFIDRLKAKLSVKPSHAGREKQTAAPPRKTGQRAVEAKQSKRHAEDTGRKRSPRGARKHPSKSRQQPAETKAVKAKQMSKHRPTKPIRWDPAVFDVPPTDGLVRFHDFDLPQEIMHAIYDLGYRYCTPIQAEILPSTLAGQDASGRAQTGTGKTAAF